MNDCFNFYTPLDIIKSEQGNSDDEEWRIGGYGSTSMEDRQGDEIIQKGIDFEDFVNYGWFNHDHDNTKILGYPDKNKCKIDSKGFYVEGVLLKGVELARTIWETALALKKSGAPRKLGFSVEGKILKRNQLGKIIKAKIYNVAITANPVNPSCTWEALCKSFTDNPEEIDKAMEAGYGVEIGEVNSGAAVIPESLDSAFKIIAGVIGDDEQARKNLLELKQRLNKEGQILTKGEMTLYFQLTKGLSYAESASLVNKLLTQVKED